MQSPAVPAWNLATAAWVVAALLVGAAGAEVMQARASHSGRTYEPTGLLGARLPAVSLRTARGDTVQLSRLLAGRPSVLVVASAADCLSCARYAFELRILERRLPGLATFVIGSGPEEATFADYFRSSRIEAHGLLDTEGALLRSLGVPRAPLVLVVGGDGHILFTDARTGSASAQFPLGRLLPALAQALALPSPECATTSIGCHPNHP